MSIHAQSTPCFCRCANATRPKHRLLLLGLPLVLITRYFGIGKSTAHRGIANFGGKEGLGMSSILADELVRRSQTAATKMRWRAGSSRRESDHFRIAGFS